MKRILMLISVCSVLSGTGCKSHQEKEKEKEIEFSVTAPVKIDTSITKDYVCQIHSIRHIELRAQEKGYLQEIFVNEGQSVKKGQLLFQIRPRIYRAELQKARAEVDFAEIEYLNTKKLADSNVVAPNELALAKAELDEAKAELALAQIHLDLTQIRAPFDGIIGRFHLRLGSLVEEGHLLTTLSDNSKMWVYFNVSEAEYLDYEAGIRKDSVNLLLANNEVFEYEGVVEVIEADFNNETGNISFRATFPNPDGLLRHGQTGNIQMHVPLNNALIIPQKSTYEILDKKYVFVVNESGEVMSREITIGAAMQDLFIVSKGLTENENILLEGLRKVQSHDKISYKYIGPMAVISNLRLPAE